MFYKDKKNLLSFLGELITYAYIFSAFFSSKLNMKVGYFLLLTVFFYIYFNRESLNLINKKIYGIFLLIFFLGVIWNYVSADIIGMNKFININAKFFYGIAMIPFLANIKKTRFNILIFLCINLLSALFLYNEEYTYHLVDDLGRFRIILLIGWIYMVIYSFEKFLEDYKKMHLLIYSILPFIALVKSGSRMGFLALLFTYFTYIIFKLFENKKNIKLITIVTIIILLLGFFLPKNYVQRLKTSFQTSKNISNEDRIIMWKAGLEIFKENPIFGVGTYEKKIYPHIQNYVKKNVKNEQLKEEFLREERFAKLHNMYVDFFVQNGILGFLYLLLLFIFLPLEFIKSRKNNESIAAIFSIIFYYFYGLTWSLWSGLGISQVLFHIFLAWMLVNLNKNH